MKNQSLIIHDNSVLYEIFNEISKEINFSIIETDKKKILSKTYNDSNFLILTKKKILDLENQIILNKLPINIFNLIEKINVEFLKIKFTKQSEIRISKYKFNINSREMSDENRTIKLTEKEINSIIYLFKANKPIKVQELQEKVWGYHSGLDTHTVETHIYRLRKKISKVFQDKQFILSISSGYQII